MPDKFVDLREMSSAGKMKIHHDSAGSVIKSTSIKEGMDKRRIVHHSAKTKVAPILDKDLIIGVRVTCACGEVTEVFFKYDNNPKSL
ncbi:MAG: hypothetical protein H6696_08215 [Deferribacteres bacterium]|nr:hypothetical protein [Deferribacteres bacterium]